jgi:hypothetical protein
MADLATRRVLTNHDLEAVYSKIGSVEDKLDAHLVQCAELNGRISSDIKYLVEREKKREERTDRDAEFKGRLKTLRPWILGIVATGAVTVAGVIGGKVASSQAPQPTPTETTKEATK